jgi:hypothetical protein
MDLLSMLAKEHTKTQTDKIVQYVGNDKERFAVLMQLFLKGEYRITQRAAWPLSYCVRQYPELIAPYYKSILDNLKKGNLHVAIIRNTMRMLQDVSIPKKFQGRVMSICFDYIQSPETPIAVKAFSLTVLQNLSRDYPEILPEVKLIIEEQWDQSTPAFRSRAKRILKGL